LGWIFLPVYIRAGVSLKLKMMNSILIFDVF
jgi:hypothetical protein